MKEFVFKVYIYDSEPRYGGWWYMETIKAESFNVAYYEAQKKYETDFKLVSIEDVNVS